MTDIHHMHESEASPEQDGMRAIYPPHELYEHIASMLPLRISVTHLVLLILERMENLHPEEVEAMLTEEGLSALRPQVLVKVKMSHAEYAKIQDKCHAANVEPFDVLRGQILNIGKQSRHRLEQLAADGREGKTVRAA